MEDLPIEVIGIVLSWVGAARDLVVASLTCRKWQQAWSNHVHTLAFDSNDWPVYDELTKNRLEVIITRTIFQTKALQCLSISLKNNVEFSAAPVIAWISQLQSRCWVLRCPKLRKLVIGGDVPVVVTKDECLIVAKFTGFINTLSMIYPHVAFQCLV